MYQESNIDVKNQYFFDRYTDIYLPTIVDIWSKNMEA